MCLWQVSLADNSGSLIGHLSVTFGGAPNFDVADSFGGAYLGVFRITVNMLNAQQLTNNILEVG